MIAKYKIFLMTVVLGLGAVSACGFESVHSTVEAYNGSESGQPTTVLACIEASDGVIVVDGRLEVLVYKDQFHQYSAKIIQRDQLSGDKLLVTFLSVRVREPNSNSVVSDVTDPKKVYTAETEGSEMVLHILVQSEENKRFPGTLLFKLTGLDEEIIVGLSCSRLS